MTIFYYFYAIFDKINDNLFFIAFKHKKQQFNLILEIKIAEVVNLKFKNICLKFKNISKNAK